MRREEARRAATRAGCPAGLVRSVATTPTSPLKDRLCDMLKWFRRKTQEEPTRPEVETGDQTPETAVSPDAGTPVDEAAEPAVAPEPATPVAAPEAAQPQAPEPAPVPKKSLFARLREGLSRTKTAMVDRIRQAIRLHGKVDEELLEEIEDILIQSDVGVATTRRIVDRMRAEARGVEGGDAVMALFKRAVSEILTQNNRPLRVDAGRPSILLFVGVNGTGKTTTIGKIGRELTAQGRRVMMVAADTFRAAAADQLQIWAERTGAAICRQDEGADPASVVYEALEGARRDTPDVILIDTAGRLHTKVNLMEELKKIRRVIQRHYPDAPHETVLVLDATTGQNALNQLKTFHEATELTGIVMTKLDGTARGGTLVACKDAYQLPVFKIGIGEQPEDLRVFDPEDFVEALFSVEGNGQGLPDPES